jgi:hypothetical protein
VLSKTPRDWLVHGLGREMPGNPGWSVVVKPRDDMEERINPLLEPEVLGLFHRLLDALAPFPEARAAAAEKLVELDVPVREKRREREAAARAEENPDLSSQPCSDPPALLRKGGENLNQQ